MNVKLVLPMLSLLALVVATGCSDNEDNDDRTPEALPLPDRSKIVLFETINSDGHRTDRTDTYLYSDNKLIKHTAHQSYFGMTVEREVNVAYPENQAIFTDQNGNAATYTIGKNGYATECTYREQEQTRRYTFIYTEDFLTQVNEEIDGDPFASIELSYKQGNLQTITKDGQVSLFRTGGLINLYQLPCLQMLDIHPLSMHIDAIFAHLLGRQSYHFVSRSAPEGNSAEWTDFTYKIDANNKPAEIVASTTSTGTVYDDKGNPSQLTRTDRRVIKIEVE